MLLIAQRRQQAQAHVQRLATAVSSARGGVTRRWQTRQALTGIGGQQHVLELLQRLLSQLCGRDKLLLMLWWQ